MADQSFADYLKRRLGKGVRDVNNIAVVTLLTTGYVYSIFEDGIEEATEYFFIATVFLFMIHLQYQLFLLIRYRETSTYDWIVNSIVFIVLGIGTYYILDLKQIRTLLIMSGALFVITNAVPYLVGHLRK